MQLIHHRMEQLHLHAEIQMVGCSWTVRKLHVESLISLHGMESFKSKTYLWQKHSKFSNIFHLTVCDVYGTNRTQLHETANCILHPCSHFVSQFTSFLMSFITFSVCHRHLIFFIWHSLSESYSWQRPKKSQATSVLSFSLVLKPS
jgi:hypothetical protein